MPIKQDLQKDIKDAMKAGEKEKLDVLRFLLAAIRKKEIDDKKELDEQQTIELIVKMIKTHQESIEAFQKGNRPDLAEKELFELNILSQYLPEQLSEEEVREIILNAIATTGATSIKDMGKVLSLVREKLVGRTDMAKVALMIKENIQT